MRVSVGWRGRDQSRSTEGAESGSFSDRGGAGPKSVKKRVGRGRGVERTLTE